MNYASMINHKSEIMIQRNKKLITYAKQNIQKAQIFLRKQKFHR